MTIDFDREDEVLVDTGKRHFGHLGNYYTPCSVPVYVSLPFIGPRTPLRHEQWVLCEYLARDKRRAELWREFVGGEP